jgi:hypothetical protein
MEGRAAVIQLILYIVLGLGLLCVLFLFWRRDRASAEGGAQALQDARNALDTLQLSLLPPEVVARIFARDDLEYVESTTPEHIQKYFFKERRHIALMWINQLRSQIVNLRRFHLGRSRFYAVVDTRTEIGLALSLATLISACHVLQVLLYVRGSLGAPRMVGATIAKAARVCEISAKSLDFLNSLSRDAVSNGPTGDEAA